MGRDPNSGHEFVPSRSRNNELYNHFTAYFFVLISKNHSNVTFVILIHVFYSTPIFISDSRDRETEPPG